MAWFGDKFGDGLSSIKGQITKFTNDVLSEDPLAASSFEGKIKQLEERNSSLQNEIDKLRSECQSFTGGKGCELSDYQIQSICELESKIFDLTNEKDALTKALEEIETEHQKELEIVIKDRDQLKAQYGSIKIANKVPNKEEVSDLWEQIKSLQLQNDILFEEGKSKDAELKKCFSKIDFLNSELAALRLQIDQHKDKTSKSNSKKYTVIENNEDAKHLEDESLQMLSNISELSKKIKELEESYELEKSKTKEFLKVLEDSSTAIAGEEARSNNLTLHNENISLLEPTNITIVDNLDFNNYICNFRLSLHGLLKHFERLSIENNKLQEKYDSIDFELTNFKQKLSFRDNENLEINDKLKSLNYEMENVLLKNLDLEETIKDQNIESYKKTNEINRLRKEMDNILLDKAHIEKTVNDQNIQFDKFTEETRNLKKEIKDVLQKNGDLEKTIKGGNNENSQEIENLKEKIKKLLLKNTNLEEAVKDHNEQKNKKTEEIKNLKEKMENELLRNADLEDAIKRYNLQLNESVQEVKNLQEENQKLLLRLQGTVDENATIVDILTKEKLALQNEIKNLPSEDSHSSLKQLNENLKIELTNIKEELSSTNNKYMALMDAQNEIVQFKLNYEEKLEKLQNENDSLALEELPAQAKLVDDLKTETEKLKAENEELRNRIANVSSIEAEVEKDKEENNVVEKESEDVESFSSQLDILKSNYEQQLEDLQKENTTLKFEMVNNSETLRENEQLKSKLEKLEILVARTEERENLVSGTLELEIGKLKSLVGRIRKEFLRDPIEQAAFCEEEPTENVMIQSQTDDVKRIQQDVLQMTEVIKMIDQGLTSIYEDKRKLEKELSIIQSLAVKTDKELLLANKSKQQLETNIQEWAAAVANRDEIIQHLSLNKSALENDCLALKNEKDELNGKLVSLTQELDSQLLENCGLKEKLAGMEAVSLEWNKRIDELQNLYKGESERCDQLRKRKDEEIAALNKLISQHDPKTSNANDDDAPSIISHDQLQEAQHQVERLLDENSDLKVLIQQLRENIIAMNSKLPEIGDDAQQKTGQSKPQNEHKDYQALLTKHNSLIEKETSLRREVERLRAHMVEVEENYTEEVVVAKTELAELRAKLSTVEDQLQKATSVHKSANVRSTQHVEALQVQVQLTAEQRNDLQKQLSDAEDEAQKQAAALASLQLVLEQFQLDKQREMKHLEERLAYQIDLERRRCKELEVEADGLMHQLSDAKNGLKAALRLGEQLEHKSLTITDLEEELKNTKQNLQVAQENLKTINHSTNAKIDKFLVKNLVIGYLTAQGDHKNEALKVLTSVLELSEAERAKVGVENQGGWLSHLLHPSPNNPPSEPLSQAFVRFLESESKPQPHLKLLTDTPKSHSGVKRTPLALSDLVLPPVTPTQVTDTTLSDMLEDS